MRISFYLRSSPDPLDPFKLYDQDAVRRKICTNPIAEVEVGDYVVSHDKGGNIVLGYVPRTMTNDVKILLNFHGTRVTPGHVYYRPDGKRVHKYETFIDLLRDGGVIETRDGKKRRTTTHVPVGDFNDDFVQAVARKHKANAKWRDQALVVCRYTGIANNHAV